MSERVKTAKYGGVEVLTEAECRQIVARKLKTNDAEVLNVATRPLNEERSGFLGDHYRVTITASSSKCQPTELHFFVKITPNNFFSDMVMKMGAYRKETHFFSVLMRDLMKYDEDLKVDGSQPTWACECYLTTPSKIVLEDVSTRGFRNHGQLSFMDKEHCHLVIQTLARFHASSIVFEEKETQRSGVVCRLDAVYPDQFQESFWIAEKGHPSRTTFATSMRSCIASFKYLPSVRDDVKRQEELAERMFASYDDACSLIREPAKKLRCVVSHGDLWTNNILIRYEDEKPVEVKLVDFQMIRYTAPAHDFISFLHLNTRRHLRDQHLLDFALTYHEALRAELSRHNLAVDDILPWDQFETSLQKYREMVVLITSFFYPIVHMDPEMMADGLGTKERFQEFMFESRDEEVCRSFETSPMFKEVVTECLEELIELLDRRRK